SRHENGNSPGWLAAAAILITACWQAGIFAGQTQGHAPLWLNVTAGVACGLAALSAILFMGNIPRRAPALAALPIVAMLLLPLASALSVVLIRPNVAAPLASLAAFSETTSDTLRTNPRRAAPAREKLIAFLQQHRSGEKFLVAVENALLAGPIIVATGEPVIAIGGYLGTDPILTADKFAALAESGTVRFVMIGGFSLSRRDQQGEIALREWVRKNAARVDPALWSLSPNRAGQTYQLRLGGALTEMAFPELYDLKASPR
ncbi:MAG TPA: hypothetical protein PL193_12495, partial [Xanthobacteraceae bacterium]|nr:hypothetical protein [Xanthobacteraceae bacterium]